ncbi:hypothetical protein LCGC14_1641010 [marine sediment metagenome]|uniref:Uncharacterized protein n=1 Tax=marine sediment metagenome TaxID=412755 RepID=A0A0F9KFF9_9ZZZZ
MKVTSKAIKFWDNMFDEIEHKVEEAIKLYLKEIKGQNTSYSMYYGVRMGDGLPVRVVKNASCSCHPEMETVFTLSAREIVFPSLLINRLRKEEKVIK